MAYNGNIILFENGVVVGNGGQVPPPTKYSTGFEDVDVDTKRTASGVMIRNRVRPNIYVVHASWDKLTWEQAQTLLTAGDASEFNVTVVDPRTVGGHTTKKVYRSGSIEVSLNNIYSEEEAYWSISDMQFIGI